VVGFSLEFAKMSGNTHANSHDSPPFSQDLLPDKLSIQNIVGPLFGASGTRTSSEITILKGPEIFSNPAGSGISAELQTTAGVVEKRDGDMN